MNYHIRGPLRTVLFHFLLGAFRNFAISFDMPVYPSVCLSIRMEHLCCRRKDFHEIWFLNIFRNFVTKVQVSLKYGKNNGYFT
jgi:hypothetical protein